MALLDQANTEGGNPQISEVNIGEEKSRYFDIRA